MRKAPAFQFYADDFVSGTADMSAEEVGVYIRLLCHQWAKGSIPNDPERVARIAGIPSGVAIGSPSLGYVLAKFELSPDGNLRNRRMEEVRLEQVEYSHKQSEAGRIGAKKRWGNGNRHSNPIGGAIATPLAEPIPNDGSPSPSPINTPLPPKGGEDCPASVKDLLGQDTPPANTPKPHAKGPLQLRAEALMRRRPSTPLTSGESKAFSKNRAAILATPEPDWQALESYYRAEIPRDDDIRRRDLGALLNNWNGEIDRAKAWLGKHPRATALARAKDAPLPEPPNWPTFVATAFPECPYAPGRPKHGAQWAEVERAHQRMIADAMAKESAK